MDTYILIEYELKGKIGKILVREELTEEEIKEACVLDRLQKINEKILAPYVKILKKGEDNA